MGFALPAAIGAKFGAPDRTVVAIIGDGGFQMTIQELGTIMQSGIDVNIIILNNHFLGMVRQWQQLFHDKRYSFVDITSPDFVQVAKGYHIEGRSVSKREELQGALKEMLDHKGSYLLEVMVTGFWLTRDKAGATIGACSSRAFRREESAKEKTHGFETTQSPADS